MRIYLEAQEQIALDAGIEPDFIRADITGKTDAEVEEIKTLIKEIMAGITYMLLRHYCYHDEGKPCSAIQEL